MKHLELMRTITYNKQYIDEVDKKKVYKALSEKKITTGDQIVTFEKNLKKYLGCQFVSCVNSGTSAIHIAIKSLDLEKGSIVIMPAINFIASYNCAKNLGLKIYLSDVDPETGQTTPENIESTIKKNNLKKIDLVITMYLGGQPNNVLEYYKLKKKYNFFLVEDACHALGAQYLYNKISYNIGCSKHCDISTFSLHPLKTITTGEGGVITTNNKILYKKIQLLRSHGILRSKKKYWNYDVVLSGHNFRMSDINAALGNSQLKKINKFISNRRQTAKLYIKKLKSLKEYCKLLLSSDINLNQSAWHLALLALNFKKLNGNKDILMNYFVKNKIYLQVHYIPVYRFSIFKRNKKIYKNFPGAENYFKNTVSLPIFYKINNRQINLVINTLNKYIKKNKK